MSRVLLVEDDEMNRHLFREILRYRGHDVIEAATVDEGREQLRREIPDLVLLDIRIPGGGGEALLKEIRADPRLMGLPVIAVTAEAMQGDRERFLRAGFDGYISKPVDTRRFGPEVEAFIKQGKFS